MKWNGDLAKSEFAKSAMNAACQLKGFQGNRLITIK